MSMSKFIHYSFFTYWNIFLSIHSFQSIESLCLMVLHRYVIEEADPSRVQLVMGSTARIVRTVNILGNVIEDTLLKYLIYLTEGHLIADLSK